MFVDGSEEEVGVGVWPGRFIFHCINYCFPKELVGTNTAEMGKYSRPPAHTTLPVWILS